MRKRSSYKPKPVRLDPLRQALEALENGYSTPQELAEKTIAVIKERLHG